MFERFFGPKNEEQIERDLFKIADKEFKNGVNGPAMFHAFKAVKKRMGIKVMVLLIIVF